MANWKKNQLSRREMLKRTGFTAASAGFVPASALAQQAQPPEHQHKAQGESKPSGLTSENTSTSTSSRLSRRFRTGSFRRMKSHRAASREGQPS